MFVPGGPPEGQYVQAGPIRMHYLEFGKRGNPTIVFLHGSGPGNSAWANFQFNAEYFAKSGFHVLLPDLIGFGYSDKPVNLGDYTLDLFCSTLMDLLKTLGIEKCSFLGNSLGGGIAIQIALNAPECVEKLILMGPGCLEEQNVYWPMPGIQRMMEINAQGVTKETQKEVLKLFVYNAAHITDALVDMRWVVAQTQPKEVLSTMKTPELGSKMRELSCPILTFWGRQDEFMPPQGKAKCIEANESSRLIEVNACGHWVMIEHADMFNRTSVDFMRHG